MAISFEQDLTASSLATVCLLAIGYAIISLLQVGRRPSGLPLGPRTLPLIGNLYLMPTFKPYKRFAEWGKIYGPVYSLMVGSSPLVMLQSHKAAKDLLDKRGSNYSSRPNLYIVSNLASQGLRQVVMVSLIPYTQQGKVMSDRLLNLTVEIHADLASDPPNQPQDLEC
jgi:hypothetical protein